MADFGLSLANIIERPIRTRRTVMERRHHALNPGLSHVIDGHQILGSEPAPGLLHALTPAGIQLS